MTTARTPQGGARRARGRRTLASELLHALVVAALAVVGWLAIPVLHLAVPLLAEGERALVRATGAGAPAGRRPDEDRWPWLSGRVARAAFWRQDLPLVLGGALLGAGSFLVGGVGLVGAATMLASPFLASPEHPVSVDLGSYQVEATSDLGVWWLVPAGLLVLALTAALLLAIGRLRALMARALSRPDDEERLEELSAEVGHLAAGRATLVDAFDAERGRIERDLHDGAQQELVALSMSLGMARLHAEQLAGGPAGAVDHGADDRAGDPADDARRALLTDLDAAQDRAETALRALRETVHGIRPAVLTERGLAPALHDLAGCAPLPTTVTITGAGADLAAITSPVATAVYFAVSEALTNAARHAGDGAAAHVRLDVGPAGLTASVTDNGVGGADPAAPGSTGLVGMAQRVESVGGRLEVVSPGGAGTKLSITAPLTPPWAGPDESRGDVDAARSPGARMRP